MANDLQRVEERIVQVRDELARLETTRAVLLELHAAPAAAKGAGGAHGGVNGKSITIRRLTDPVSDRSVASQPAAAAKPQQPSGKERQAIRRRKQAIQQRVMGYLKDRAMSSTELIDRLKFTTKQDRQMVYNLLLDGRKNGRLTRDDSDNRRYSVAPPQ